MIAEVAHRNRRRVWNCLPKQVHAGCLDYAAVVTCPGFAEKGAKLSFTSRQR